MAGMIAGAAEDSKYVVLRSAGADFCLGRDSAGRPSTPPKDALEYRGNSEVVFDFYNAFRKTPIPVVGVVQGRALGFGCAMASLCDITIAADSARFALPEMGHNIMPTMAMSALTDRIGLKSLLYITYTTEEIDAETARAWGLVSKVAPLDQLDAAVDRVLVALNRAKPAALRAVKEFGFAAQNMDQETANGYAGNLHATINTAAVMQR
jgi:enoyl-CoA hydratase